MGDKTVRGRIVNRLERLRLGNFGEAKSVGNGVSELRYTFDAGYRDDYTVHERSS